MSIFKDYKQQHFTDYDPWVWDDMEEGFIIAFKELAKYINTYNLTSFEILFKINTEINNMGI